MMFDLCDAQCVDGSGGYGGGPGFGYCEDMFSASCGWPGGGPVYFAPPGSTGGGSPAPPCDDINVLLPSSGAGYITKAGNQLYGRPAIITEIEDLAALWSEDYPGQTLSIVEISAQGGGVLPPHVGTGHASGTAVDIRPLRTDGLPLPTSINDATYSHDATSNLVSFIKGNANSFSQFVNLNFIQFNDPNINTVHDRKGVHTHDNHLHLDFTDTEPCVN